MDVYIQGLTMGLAYVAPIGLQNLFVINSALSLSTGRALFTAWIVTFFDVTLALACFFGIGFIMEAYEWLQAAVLLGGSLVIIYLAVGLIRAGEETVLHEKSRFTLRRTVITACVVTWFNPQAIIDGTMMLGAFQASLPPESGVFFISGVVSASCLWFSSITLIVSRIGNILTGKVLQWINRLCGVVILIYGLILLRHFITLASIF